MEFVDRPRGPAYAARVSGGVRQILALGGGGFSTEPGTSVLDEYALSLCARARPRVCFLPTASGDADHCIVRFYQAFSSARCDPSHVSVFRRTDGAARERLLSADLIYVGGGDVLGMLGAWERHGIDALLREASDAGVVLCGVSAGSLCWFTEGVSAFHGGPRRVAGLGLLPGSNSVHADDGEGCLDAHTRFVGADMPAGHAVDNGAALHFVDGALHDVVADRPGCGAHWIERASGGGAAHTRLRARSIGPPEPEAASVRMPAVRVA
jgi:peptidase E